VLIAADDKDGFAVCRRLKTGRDILFRSRVMALLSARR